MDYREALIEQIGDYYEKVIEKYKYTTVSAMQTARKMSLFKKQEYSGHIENFRGHIKDALEISGKHVDVPESDPEGKELKEKFYKSIGSFCRLCETNIKFYRISDKKQYRDSGIGMKDYKLAYQVMEQVLAESVEELNELDKAYAKYAPENASRIVKKSDD